METVTDKPIVLCDTCGNECKPDGISTGYATNSAGAKFCFACCAEQDKRYMIEHGKIILYLTHNSFAGGFSFVDGKVSNWPGSLSFPARVKRGCHNIARYRYDFWFTGPDGHKWYGYQIGDNTQIAHCKRVKG